jgi:hypothetical protein
MRKLRGASFQTISHWQVLRAGPIKNGKTLKQFEPYGSTHRMTQARTLRQDYTMRRVQYYRLTVSSVYAPARNRGCVESRLSSRHGKRRSFRQDRSFSHRSIARWLCGFSARWNSTVRPRPGNRAPGGPSHATVAAI